jgi:hypothetical protein
VSNTVSKAVHNERIRVSRARRALRAELENLPRQALAEELVALAEEAGQRYGTKPVMIEAILTMRHPTPGERSR